MKKPTQKDTNPFIYSDTDKRYHTYDYYLRHAFGGKCAKISLDAGFTCPNIDGRCGYGGCIYCSGRGSGDFAADSSLDIETQYRKTMAALQGKWCTDRILPYFQAHTNTYAPLERLRPLYETALALPGAVGINIATRGDCIEEDVLLYLKDLSERTVLTLELGLQTIHDRTATLINRGHTWADFCRTYRRIRERAPRIRIGVHLIFGLPGEDDDMMLEGVRAVAALHPDEVKLHLLYVVEGTPLAEMYLRGEYLPLDMDHYVSLVVRALTLLPPETVVGRLTGDGDGRMLLAPIWSRRKREVLASIDKALYQQGYYQGLFYN